MWTLSAGAGELIVRACVVYVLIFALLRIFGKKHVGQMSPFDLVVLLLLSESVQNALIADEKSLTGGIIVATTLVGLSGLIGHLVWRSKPLSRVLDGTPTILVRNGHVRNDALKREKVTRSELMEALRQQGCTSLLKVRYAILENDGNITIGLRS